MTESAAQASQVPLGIEADRDGLSALDYIEIQQLYARYAAGLDFGDGAARAATFTPDGTFTTSITPDRTPISVAEVAERTVKLGNIGDRHMTLQLIITPTETGADGFAYAIRVDRQGKVGTGFYNDTLVKTPEGWRFKARVLWHDFEKNSPYRGIE
jgi:hypothetical protein